MHYEETSYFWFFFFFSAFITGGLRFLVLGRALPPPYKASPPATTPCPRCQHIDDALLPPSLSPSSESKPCPEELLAEAKRRMSQKPSIPRFAICTTLAILNILAMVLMAFANQSLLYCDNEVTAGTPIAKHQQTTDAVLIWFVYTLSASSGILCWAMWMRNLWGGPEAAERWPIRSDLGAFPLLGAIAVLCIPVILVFVVAAGLWHGLCMCFCRKPLKRADAEAVEMETGIGCDSGNVIGEDDGNNK
jgi:hypothetical protein